MRFPPLTLRIVLAAVLAVLLGYVAVLHLPGPGGKETSVFLIPPGSASRAVARTLAQEGYIHSQWVFLLHLVLSGKSGTIIAGEHSLHRAMSSREVARVITQGGALSPERAIIIKEGWTVSDISAYLQTEGISSPDSFLQAARNTNSRREAFSFLKDLGGSASLEGYLFPDTYRISKDATPEEIVDTMLATFARKVGEELLTEASSHGRSFRDVIILASIVEREVGRNVSKGTQISDAVAQKLQEEREIVAGIFWNRLRINMPLQADSTVNYATGKNTRNVTSEDIVADSPYNTYLHRGLPPGPIGNPGLASIRSTLFPKETDYLYFLSKPDGEAVFARTLDEHNQNKARYLR